MSRRYTSRSAAPVEVEDQERAQATVLPWWFATPMPEPWERYLWHQWGSAWAELSLEVCHNAYRRHGARLYATHRNIELRDDLQDWLIIKGVEAMADFIPDPQHPAPDRQWAAFLHRRFDRMAPQHFKDVVGRIQTPSGKAAVETFNRGISSTERLAEMEAEGGVFVSRHPLHAQGFETADPAHVLIHLEELQEKVQKIEREDKRQGIYSTASTVVGQACLTAGCDRPSIARGLCRPHYNKNRRQSIGNCKEDDCLQPIEARGWCSTHYETHRAQAIAEGTWTAYETPPGCSVDGCPSTEVHALGLCPRHYDTHRRATGPRCQVEGCDLAVKSRGMCSTHWRHWKRARDAGEGEAYL